MKIIKEYRITLPMSVEEYKIGHQFVEEARNAADANDGVVEVVFNQQLFTNRPLLGNQYSEGRCTSKVISIANTLSAIILGITPRSLLFFDETTWNAFPYTRTVFRNRDNDNSINIAVDSLYLPGRGEQENVHRLSRDLLLKREVIRIDIGSDLPDSSDYKADEDPKIFQSTTTGRGPLVGNWSRTCDPVMTCYIVVTSNFASPSCQHRLEQVIQRYDKRFFTNFHRRLFCWIDRWYGYGLTLQNIREIEEAREEADR